MPIVRIVQNVGLGLFLFCLTAFIGVLFLGKYQPTDQALSTVDGTEAVERVNEKLGNRDAARFNKFQLLGVIDQEIQKVNEAIKAEKGIPAEAVDEMLQGKSSIVFQEETIEALSLSADQKQQLKDYSNWLYGKEFNAAAFEEKMQGILESINEGVVSNHGIDNYKSKSVKTQILQATAMGVISQNAALWFWLIIVLGAVAGLLYIFPKLVLWGGPGIKNNGIFHHPMTSRKWLGIITGSLLILFYIVLYWFPYYLVEWMVITEPISNWLSGGDSSQWFVYGLLYTLAILVMGVRMFIKYRHSKYHMVRTASVMFFQLAFAFVIPQLLAKNSLPAQDLKNMWPLDYSFFFDYRLDQMIEAGTIGLFMLGWGIALFVIGVPLFTYFYGKRWYCSWVCGCGGLAETLGDPYRQLSDKSVKSWQIERYLVHGVLVFAVVMTAMVIYTYQTQESSILGLNSYSVRSWYGFFIGSIFSGVVGTGFYPLMGNRVWCRFGCPLAAYLGIVQRFKSRFRITTNGGQCISCGNCSTYCEQGIDVRWYAQRGQNIVRASCVGCGVCASVCPRGVLKLENGEEEGRIHGPIEISGEGIKIVNE